MKPETGVRADIILDYDALLGPSSRQGHGGSKPHHKLSRGGTGRMSPNIERGPMEDIEKLADEIGSLAEDNVIVRLVLRSALQSGCSEKLALLTMIRELARHNRLLENHAKRLAEIMPPAPVIIECSNPNCTTIQKIKRGSQ